MDSGLLLYVSNKNMSLSTRKRYLNGRLVFCGSILSRTRMLWLMSSYVRRLWNNMPLLLLSLMSWFRFVCAALMLIFWFMHRFKNASKPPANVFLLSEALLAGEECDDEEELRNDAINLNIFLLLSSSFCPFLLLHGFFSFFKKISDN